MRTNEKIVSTIRRLMPLVLSRSLPKTIRVIRLLPRESKRLNVLYRKAKKPANVLSFCYGSTYGEIMICPEIIRREAKKEKRSYRFQVTWMILHGMLHLSGVHHEGFRPAAKKFEEVENMVLCRLYEELKKHKV